MRKISRYLQHAVCTNTYEFELIHVSLYCLNLLSHSNSLFIINFSRRESDLVSQCLVEVIRVPTHILFAQGFCIVRLFVGTWPSLVVLAIINCCCHIFCVLCRKYLFITYGIVRKIICTARSRWKKWIEMLV